MNRKTIYVVSRIMGYVFSLIAVSGLLGFVVEMMTQMGNWGSMGDEFTDNAGFRFVIGMVGWLLSIVVAAVSAYEPTNKEGEQ